MKSVVEQGFFLELAFGNKHPSNFKCAQNVLSLNIVEFEFELFVTSLPLVWRWQWQWQCDSRAKTQKMSYSKYGLWNRWPQWGGY